MDSYPDSDHLSHVDCDPDSYPDSGPGARVNTALDNTVVDLTQSGYPASGKINHCNPRTRVYKHKAESIVLQCKLTHKQCLLTAVNKQH